MGFRFGARALKRRTQETSSVQTDDNKTTNGIDLAALKAQLDSSSGLNRTLGLVFVALLMYVGITLSSVTDLMLLLPNTPVTLPILSIDIPLFAFFAITPLIVLGLHLNMLLNLLAHSQKLYRWVAQNPASETVKLTEVHPFIFNRLAFAKQKTAAYWLSGFLVKVVVFYLPLILLLVFQVRFSDYHNMTMTRWHMGVAMADLILLLLFQPAILNKKNFEPNGSMLGSWLKQIFPKRIGFILFLTGNLVYSCDNVNLLGEVMTLKQSEGLKDLFEHEYSFPQDLFTKYQEDSIIHLGNSFIHKGETLSKSSWPEKARALKLDTIYPEERKFKRVQGSLMVWRFVDTVFTAINRQCLRYKPTIEVREANLLKSPIDSRYVALLMEMGNLAPEEAKRKARVEFGKGISLKGRHLSYGNLGKCVLSHADLRKAILFKANLRFAYLENANIYDAHLEGADFVYAHLEGTDFEMAHLAGADFSHALLEGAAFEMAHLEGADFSDALLEGADFEIAHLEGTDFSYALLEGARFSFTHSVGADFSNAHLKGAYFSSAILAGANFKMASLEGVDFSGTHSEGVNFSGTHLEGVNFKGAYLKGAKTTKNGFKGSLMSNVNFTISYNFDSFLMKVDSTHFSDFSYLQLKWRLDSAALRSESPTSQRTDTTDWNLFLEARLKLICDPNLTCERLVISNAWEIGEYLKRKIIWYNDNIIRHAKKECAEKYYKYIQKLDDWYLDYYFSPVIQSMIREDFKALVKGQN